MEVEGEINPERLREIDSLISTIFNEHSPVYQSASVCHTLTLVLVANGVESQYVRQQGERLITRLTALMLAQTVGRDRYSLKNEFFQMAIWMYVSPPFCDKLIV